MMKERKYPFRLFVMGLLMNMLLRYSWLLIPGVILVVVGKWISVCLYIGLALLVADVTLSFYDQMLIRKTIFRIRKMRCFADIKRRFRKTAVDLNISTILLIMRLRDLLWMKSKIRKNKSNLKREEPPVWVALASKRHKLC